MPRRTTTKPCGVGKAIVNDRRKQMSQPNNQAEKRGVAEKNAARSVLESSSLDDFIATNELSKAIIQVTRGERDMPVEGPRLVCLGEKVEAAGAVDKIQAAKKVVVPIPRRPQWEEGESGESLADREGEAFVEWRRKLAFMEEEEGLVMTPYERNLDFWRQLWRTVDRSDMLVQILDARDPEFYRCRDLEAYVSTFPAKRHLLLVNKADFLTEDLRRRWAEHFADIGTDVIFFSALRELQRQQRLPTDACIPHAAETTEEEDEGAEATEGIAPQQPTSEEGRQELTVMDVEALVEELKCRLPAQQANSEEARRGVVGFVGYPNVGKSSVINCLFGAKKVSMSRTPGKTKHLQTLEMPELGLTLCDCPGLVFPSVVATKAHLTINGTTPLDELRDALPPLQLVVGKIGVSRLMEHYGVSEAALRDGAARRGQGAGASLADHTHAFLAGFAVARQHFLRLGVPDETWAARRVLRDFVTGELLHCEPPPSRLPPSAAAAAPVTSAVPAAQTVAGAAPAAALAKADASGTADLPVDDDSDFSDLDEFLQGSAGQKKGAAKAAGRKGQTKR